MMKIGYIIQNHLQNFIFNYLKTFNGVMNVNVSIYLVKVLAISVVYLGNAIYGAGPLNGDIGGEFSGGVRTKGADG